MGKAKTRNAQAAPGTAYERIQAEVKQIREGSPFGICDARETPALAELLSVACDSLGESTPKIIYHEGRPYWLRISIGLARLEVFDNPSMSEPLVKGMAGSMQTFGHQPSH